MKGFSCSLLEEKKGEREIERKEEKNNGPIFQHSSIEHFNSPFSSSFSLSLSPAWYIPILYPKLFEWDFYFMRSNHLISKKRSDL